MKNLKKSMTFLILVFTSSTIGKLVFKVPKVYSEKSNSWYKKSKSWNLFNSDSQLTNFDRNKLTGSLFFILL